MNIHRSSSPARHSPAPTASGATAANGAVPCGQRSIHAPTHCTVYGETSGGSSIRFDRRLSAEATEATDATDAPTHHRSRHSELALLLQTSLDTLGRHHAIKGLVNPRRLLQHLVDDLQKSGAPPLQVRVGVGDIAHPKFHIPASAVELDMPLVDALKALIESPVERLTLACEATPLLRNGLAALLGHPDLDGPEAAPSGGRCAPPRSASSIRPSSSSPREMTPRSQTPPWSFRPIDPAAVTGPPRWLGPTARTTAGSSPPAKRLRTLTEIGASATATMPGAASAGARRWSTVSSTGSDSTDAPITNAEVDALLAGSRARREFEDKNQQFARQTLEQCGLKVPRDFKLTFPSSGANDADLSVLRRVNAVNVLRLFPAEATRKAMGAALQSLNLLFPQRPVLVTVKTVMDSREWNEYKALPVAGQTSRPDRTPSPSS